MGVEDSRQHGTVAVPATQTAVLTRNPDGCQAMIDSSHVELTSHQRELLQRGLRFVRSSIALGLGVHHLDREDRTQQISAIDSLSRQLEEDPSARPSANAS